jgi:anti-anti-sigma factor
MSEGYEKSARISACASDGLAMIEGDLDTENASQLESFLRAVTTDSDQTITLDLTGLDIEDGVAVATVINALRELRARSARLVVRGAPQILGHNLYRVGLLESMEIVDMREDEPAGF